MKVEGFYGDKNKSLVVEMCSEVCGNTSDMIVFDCVISPQTEHPFKSKKMVWHKLLSKQRRRAVVACFRMTPLYNIPRFSSHNSYCLLLYLQSITTIFISQCITLLLILFSVVSKGTGGPTCSWTVTNATGWGMRATPLRIRWSMICLWVCVHCFSLTVHLYYISLAV